MPVKLLSAYLLNILIAIDQLFNTLLLGDPDETLSSRVGKARRGGSRFGTFLANAIDLLFFWQQNPGHCERSIEYDEGGRQISRW